ncbi:MAG TPA: RHS repeat-associated core domain-containing protein [Verrucomicrobiae bacterium]
MKRNRRLCFRDSFLVVCYDEASRLVTVADSASIIGYSYLVNSPLAGQIFFTNSGSLRMTTTKQFDRLNRLLSISSAAGSSSFSSFSYVYNSANQRIRCTLPDGSFWLYTYDYVGQVTSGKRYWQDGTPVAGQQFEYGFDDIGNRKSTGVGGDASGGGLRGDSYTPNRLNQYSSRTVNGAVDQIGIANPTASVTVNGYTAYRKGEYFDYALPVSNGNGPQYPLVTVVSSYPPGQTNTGHIFVPQTPESFGYDADGNLTNDGRWNHTWDAENRLVKMESLASGPAGSKRRLEFTYDHQSRRIKSKVTNLDTGAVASDNKFLYDRWNLLAELNATNNAIIRSYVWGLDLSGSLQGAGGVSGLLKVTYNGPSTTTCFAACDGNGNILGLIKADDATVVARYEYGPFGEVLRQTGPMAKANPFRFSTKYQDEETDVLYYGHRYYNADTGRWLNRDPLGEQKEPNLFGFLGNGPPSSIDYLGLFIWVEPAYTYTRIDPIPDPKGDLFGMTDWYYFNPRAYPYQPVDCGCKYKVAVPGAAQAAAWWVRGSRVAEQHERTHINVHFKNAALSFKEEAEYRGQRCMSRQQADCIAKVINAEMKEAYKLQAYAVASEWDCQVYAGEACDRFRRNAAAYANALKVLQGALESCDSLE